MVCSTNRQSNAVQYANYTLFNYCGSNATVSFNSSWIPLGSCTNTLILTNAKALKVSVQWTARAVAGWDSETNVLFGYAFRL